MKSNNRKDDSGPQGAEDSHATQPTSRPKKRGDGNTADDIPITLKQLADRIGLRRRGQPTSRETVRGWCLHGLQGVLLWSAKRGRVRVTTWNHYLNWCAAVGSAHGRRRNRQKPTGDAD